MQPVVQTVKKMIPSVTIAKRQLQKVQLSLQPVHIPAVKQPVLQRQYVLFVVQNMVHLQQTFIRTPLLKMQKQQIAVMPVIPEIPSVTIVKRPLLTVRLFPPPVNTPAVKQPVFLRQFAQVVIKNMVLQILPTIKIPYSKVAMMQPAVQRVKKITSIVTIVKRLLPTVKLSLQLMLTQAVLLPAYPKQFARFVLRHTANLMLTTTQAEPRLSIKPQPTVATNNVTAVTPLLNMVKKLSPKVKTPDLQQFLMLPVKKATKLPLPFLQAKTPLWDATQQPWFMMKLLYNLLQWAKAISVQLQMQPLKSLMVSQPMTLPKVLYSLQPSKSLQNVMNTKSTLNSKIL